MSYETGSMSVEMAPHPLTPDEQELKEALMLPPELHATLSAEFDVIAERTIQAEIDPGNMKSLEVLLAIERWRYFGGSDLPSNVRIVGPDHGHGLALSPSLNQAALRHSWDDLMDVRRTVDSTRDTQCTEYAKNKVRRQPAYQLLSSLISDQPQNENMPLNDYWRQVYSSQAERLVRASFGIADGEALQKNPYALHVLSQELYRIDGLTMPKNSYPKSTPRQRFLNWCLEDFKLAVGDEVFASRGLDKNDIVGFVVPDGEHRAQPVSAKQGVLKMQEEMLLWSNSLSEGRLGEKFIRSDIDVRDNRLVHHVLEHCLQEPDENLRTILEWEADDTAGRACFGFKNINILLRLRGVEGEIYSITDVSDGTLLPAFHDSPTEIIPKEEYEFGMTQALGSVTLSGAGVARPQILMTGGDVSNLPLAAAEWDLRVDIDAHANASSPLVVPGFELVARRHDEDSRVMTQEFKQVEEDLYTGAETIQVTDESKRTLVEYYREIGATELVQAIEGYNEMTIDDLQKVIAQTSDYTFDTSLKTGYEVDFSTCVVNGRLQLQCTGANNFLASSIRRAMPDVKVEVISGQSIGRDGKISALGHAQVLIVYKGKKYILDATPALSMTEAGSLRSYTANDFLIEPQDFSPTEVSQPILEEAPDAPLTDTQAYFAKEQNGQQPSLRSQLEIVLRNTFRARNQKELHKIMSKLPKADPMHRALSAVIRYDKSNGERDERGQAANYLKSCFRPDNEKFRKRFDITTYDPAVIDLVLGILR